MEDCQFIVLYEGVRYRAFQHNGGWVLTIGKSQEMFRWVKQIEKVLGVLCEKSVLD